jgi:hypothetical protein
LTEEKAREVLRLGDRDGFEAWFGFRGTAAGGASPARRMYSHMGLRAWGWLKL